jgi:processive 1,2-diacylglycerol beta-glucosyltransferase
LVRFRAETAGDSLAVTDSRLRLRMPLLDLDAVGAPRVAIVSGSYGAGHDAAAQELARHLRNGGCRVEIFDVAHLLPAGTGELLKRSYYAQLRLRPGSWGTTLAHLQPGQPLHRMAVRLLALGTRRVTAAVAGHDLVVSTHPFAGQIVGRARRRGLLRVPAVTYLTDASVHPLWVHPAVDLHLAIHDVAAEQARGWGGRTATVRPIVPCLEPTTSNHHDPLAGLGIIGPRALVTGGSLGIGELEQAARDIVDSGVMTPVVACGHNDALLKKLCRIPGAFALGWRDDLQEVIGAVDCVVQNAGGFTSLEALASGTPVLSYLPIPGHGVTNAENLERAGLAAWARDRDELGKGLVDAIAAGRQSRIPTDAPTVLEVLTNPTPVLGATRRRRRSGRLRRERRISVA